MKQIIYEISQMEDSMFVIESMETDKDHVHMLVDIDPNVSATSIVSRVKQMSIKTQLSFFLFISASISSKTLSFLLIERTPVRRFNFSFLSFFLKIVL